jgi:hypothetical protein
MPDMRSVTPPPGYSCMLKSDSEELVKRWLTRFLPGLGEENLMNYRDRLMADGFDHRSRMILVREEDLHFMTSVHRRTLMSNINSVPVERWIY